MKRIKWGKRQEVDTSLLEARLQGVFQPREPRAEFVRKLRSQLVRELEPTIIHTQVEKRRLIWAIGASMIGAALALLMGVRTILTLGAAIGLLLEMKKEAQLPKPIPIRQAK